jgi:molybdate/tungstate transport system substrate-binding protein
VVLKTDYRRFASVDPVFRGEPIVYGLTVPKSAPNPEAAAQFVEFILRNEGQTILSEALQPPIVPPRVDHAEMLPQRLKRLVSP